MKRSLNIFVCLCIASVFCAGQARCAPTGGTRFPAKGQMEAGYEFHTLFERELAREFGRIETQNHFYTISYGLTDWLALDLKAGLGDTDHVGGATLPDLDYSTGFAGGYGFRISALNHEPSGLGLILGGQHISVHPQDIDLEGKHYEAFLDDWQLSAIVSMRVKFLTIYGGTKISDQEIVYKIDKKDRKRRFSEDHVGVIVGADAFFSGDIVRVNIEGRFIDETALSAAIGYLF